MIGVKKNIIVVSMGFMQMAMVNAKITSRKKPYQTGADNRVQTARVTNIEVMLPENAPYPVSKMKKIIGLAEEKYGY